MAKHKQSVGVLDLRFYLTSIQQLIKTRWLALYLSGIMLLCAGPTQAQNTWAAKTDLPGDARGFAFSFAIGTKIYVGSGVDGAFVTKNDVWEYDTGTDTWTQKANFTGGGRYGAVAFTLNGKGYVGLGNDAYSSTMYKDIWEYNPIADSWTQLTDFAGAPRLGATVFVIAGKAYIGMGQGKTQTNDAIAFNDLWLFDLGDPDIWSQKASLPAVNRYFPVGFSIGATGYVGGGDDISNSALADFWQYNPYSDSWAQKADLGSGARAIVPGVSLNGKGYVGSGGFQDFWQYDPQTNSWTQKASLPNTTSRTGAIAVSVNGKIFLGTGLGLKDFYEYTQDADPIYTGSMYGATVNGGINGSGVIFKASSTGTGVTSIYNFDPNAINGANPWGKVTYLNGKLYGTTPLGAINITGVVYQLDLNGNVYTHIADLLTYGGQASYGGLTFAGGKLYGLSVGYTPPYGFIFEVDPATNTFTKKASFNGTNGSIPYGGELLLVGNKLYGMTMAGGANGVGTIFEYDFKENTITKKADFNGPNGSQPRGSLVEYSGLLYGVTSAGGASDKGVLFEFDINTGTIIKRKDFGGNDGEVPYGGLTVLNDKLYGVTTALGAGYTGVIFEYDPASQVFTKKFDFDNTSAYTGANPYGAMTNINGKLYGTTDMGGDNNKGALFSYDVNGGGFTKIFSFDDTNGAGPVCPITFVRDNQTLSFDPLPSKIIGDVPFQLTATGSLGFPVQFYSSDESVATISGNTVTITGSGTTTITAYIGRDNHFTSVNQNLFVDKKAQTITFNAVDPKIFGDASFQVNATASSGLVVSYQSDNSAVATVSGNTITIVGAGTAMIKAMQSGNAEYNAAADVPQALTVTKANQTITFGQLPAKTFGDSPIQLGATSTSGLAVVFDSDNSVVGSVNSTTLTIGNAGTATITASQPGNANYNAATQVQNTLTVAKASQVITFIELPTKTLGDPPFTLTGTSLFDVPTYSSSNLNVATINGATVTITGEGQTDISASYAGSANVLPAVTVTRTLTVKMNQVITFAALGTVAYVPTLQLTATANSGLPVAYTSETSSVATISGNTVTIVGVGTTKVTASQAGDASYNAATNVSQVLTVTKADQTLTFDAITDRKLSDPKFNLNGTSTSGLTVNFSTTSDRIQLSGAAVTIVAPGNVTISATQPGNSLYNAAPAIQRSFCVAPSQPTISLSNDNSISPILTSSAAIGNQWYLNGTAIPGATNQMLTVAQAGTYKVQASVDACTSDFSDNFSMSVTAIEAPSPEKIAIYPNPVDDKLTISISNNKGSIISLLRVDGSVVQAYQTASTILEIDVSQYPVGLYLLNIQNGTIQHIEKFIKK